MKPLIETPKGVWRVGCYWPGVAVGLTLACGFFGGIQYSRDEIDMWVFGSVPFRAVIGEILFDNIGPAYLASVVKAIPFTLFACSCAWLLSGLSQRKFEGLFLASTFGGLVGSAFFFWDEYPTYHYGPIHHTFILAIVCLLCSLGAVVGSVLLSSFRKSGNAYQLDFQYSLKKLLVAITMCCVMMGTAVSIHWENWNPTVVWILAFATSQVIVFVALISISALVSLAGRYRST